MKKTPRPLLITAAVTAIGGWAALTGGCASKPPAPEPPAEPQKTQPLAQSTGGSIAGKSDPSSSGSPASSVPSGAGSGGASTAGQSTGGAGAATSGNAASAGAWLPVAGSPSNQGSVLPPARGQTAEERRAAIDKSLNDSLGTFDAKLRIEQQKIAKERDGRQTAVTTVAASDSGSANVGNDSMDRGSAGTDSRSARAGNLKPDRTAGDLKSDKGNSNSAAGNGAVANEIPDGNDDDVVARRLRKAAEQETDPELKDKLWKEYVEYKKNTQGR